MNDNFYIAVSARAALKDGKRKYFLDKDGWSAEKKIVAKCNELLKEKKD